MKIIALEASGVAGSVSYIDGNKLVGEYYLCHKLTHSQTIMPMLEQLKAIVGIELEEIDAIAVTSGPGSFTGLRIGVATAKAMAMALNVPVIGIPTLDVMAHNIFFTEAVICPMMDARRNQVYTAYYEWQDEVLEQKSDYLCIQIEELLETLLVGEKDVIFLGDGVDVHKALIEEKLGSRAKFAPAHMMMPSAGTLAHMACGRYEKGEMEDANTFVPFYLRKSQAERELEEKTKHA